MKNNKKDILDEFAEYFDSKEFAESFEREIIFTAKLMIIGALITFICWIFGNNDLMYISLIAFGIPSFLLGVHCIMLFPMGFTAIISHLKDD